MTHSYTNPRSGQYLMHAHNHITWAVVVNLGSCFGLVRRNQHGIAVRQKNRTKRPMYSHMCRMELALKGVLWTHLGYIGLLVPCPMTMPC